jgi:hypothetical protein
MTFRRAAIAATAAALLVLTGCGSATESDDAASDDSSPAAASELADPGEPADSDADRAKPRDPVEPGGGLGNRLTAASFASSTSQAQEAARSTHVELEARLMGQSIEVSGDMSVGATLADTAFATVMSVPELGEDVSVILVDRVVYVSESGQSGPYTAMKLDKGDPIAKFYLQFLGQSDPAGLTRAFDGAIEDLDKVGSESLDGVETTHYRLRVDARRVLTSTLGEELPAGSWAQDLPKTLTYDVWVGDKDNLPRRLEYDVMGTSMTMTLTDWGEPVDIKAPPASQISDEKSYPSSPAV